MRMRSPTASRLRTQVRTVDVIVDRELWAVGTPLVPLIDERGGMRPRTNGVQVFKTLARS